MMINDRKQYTEYVIRELARLAVPAALDSTKNDECIETAIKVRSLPADASMDEVRIVCSSAVDVLYHLMSRRRDLSQAWVTAAKVVRAASAANAEFSYAESTAYDAGSQAVAANFISKKEYDDILAGAQELL